MKNIFFLWIVSILILISSVSSVSAQEKVSSAEASLTPSPTPVVYQLPYPGLLPDSPLYFLKALRDRIIDFLVSDPLKKAELNLLQADKRLMSGIALLEKGKGDLAESTISKGQNYFQGAIDKLEEAKKQGLQTDDLVRKVVSAADKHKEKLKELEKKAPKNVKDRFTILLKRMEKLEIEANALLPK